MSEQQERIRNASEVFEEVLKYSYTTKGEKDSLREEFEQGLLIDAIRTLRVLDGETTMSPEARRAALRRRKALVYVIAITSFPVAVAGLYAVGEYGYLGYLWFVLAGACLLVSHLIDKGAR